MDALVTHPEFGMTSFNEARATVRMVPLFDLGYVFDGDDVFDLETLGPGKREALVGQLNEVSDMASAADERAHFLR